MGMVVTTSLAVLTSPAPSFAQARVGQLGNGRASQERSSLFNHIAQRSWSTYQGANGLYEVQFPQQPQRQNLRVQTAQGNVNVTMLIYEERSGNLAFMSASNRIPMSPGMVFDAELGLNGARDGAASSMNATIEQEDRIRVQGLPARSLVMSASNSMHFQMIIIVDPDRAILYQLLVGATDIELLNSPAARQFLTSFQIR